MRFALMSMPRVAQHADRVGVQWLRMAAGAARRRSRPPTCARAAPRRSGTGRCSRCTGTTPAAGDASARSADGRRRRCEPQRGMQRTAGGLQRLAAGDEVDARSSCRGRPPSCGAPSRARRRGAVAGGTTPGSAARRPAPSTPARPDRCAPAPAAAATAPDATPAARTAAGRPPRDERSTLGFTPRTVPEPRTINQIRLMDQPEGLASRLGRDRSVGPKACGWPTGVCCRPN